MVLTALCGMSALAFIADHPRNLGVDLLKHSYHHAKQFGLTANLTHELPRKRTAVASLQINEFVLPVRSVGIDVSDALQIE